jgi:hypothetical protein
VTTMDGMFDYSPLENNPPNWYRPSRRRRRRRRGRRGRVSP